MFSRNFSHELLQNIEVIMVMYSPVLKIINALSLLRVFLGLLIFYNL